MANTRSVAGAMIDAAELDRIFDEGQRDVDQYFDVDNVEYPGHASRTVVVDLPADVFGAVTREADRTGTPISDLIAGWVAERLDAQAA